MKQELNLKKILKQEMKEILQEGWKGQLGSMLAGLGLGAMLTTMVDDPKPRTQTTDIARNIFSSQANTEQEIFRELKNLENDDLIAAIDLVTERLELAERSQRNMGSQQIRLYNRLKLKLLDLIRDRNITAPAIVRRLNRLQF